MRSLTRIPICAGLLGAVVACSNSREPAGPVAVGAPNFAEATTDQSFVPLTFVGFNPCNGDLMEVTTTLHFKVHTTFQPDGSRNSELEVNTQNTQAQDLVTGAKYVAEQEISISDQRIPPGSTFTFELSFHLIRSGETGLLLDDDLMEHGVVHITINANGTVTVDNVHGRSECM